MNLITQDASKTGKGIRTIALRLTGTKEAAEELEEMGEDTSDMIMSQSKMRDLIMNATRVASNNYQGFDKFGMKYNKLILRLVIIVRIYYLNQLRVKTVHQLLLRFYRIQKH